jgi:hypothetical protein
MTVEELFEVYKKEREYQRKAFGDYRSNSTLNVSSFLTFIEEYLEKAKKAYVYDWDLSKPPWFLESKESQAIGLSPVKTYEHLIKVFALAGAALETFLVMEPEDWRMMGVKEKWIIKKEEKK